jgi:hypothetical protein
MVSQQSLLLASQDFVSEIFLSGDDDFKGSTNGVSKFSLSGVGTKRPAADAASSAAPKAKRAIL